jgi:hypothetical protein
LKASCDVLESNNGSMIQKLLIDHPEPQRIQTTTASTNEHMSRFNLQLRFIIVRGIISFEHRVAELESILASR